MGNSAWTKVSVLLAIGAVALSLGGCASNDQFAAVDKAARDTHIAKLGHLIALYKTGSDSSIDGPGPYYHFVFTQTTDLHQKAIDRLLDNGFKPSGEKLWLIREGKSYVDATVTDIPGDFHLSNGDKRIPIPSQGATIVEFIRVPVD